MLPLIRLSGSPLEQGRTHGHEARDRIAHNLDVYSRRFQGEGRLSRDAVLERAAKYWTAIQKHNAGYAEALRGLAEGSGLNLIELVALNVRYEILYHQFTKNALADGCTAFAVLPEATRDGHLIMGQNWDWIPEVEGVVLHSVDGDHRSLCFTEAGIVGGKIGLNSSRVGLAISGLTSTHDDWARLGKPFHVRCYEVLQARGLGSAISAATDGGRSCSANFVVGQSGAGAVSIETAPGEDCRLDPADGVVAHTNHFIVPEALGIAEPPNPGRPGSVNRLTQMNRLLRAGRPHTTASLRRHLEDHTGYPDSVCRHPGPDAGADACYETVTSVVMDVDDGVMWVTDGPPCRSLYGALRLDAD